MGAVIISSQESDAKIRRFTVNMPKGNVEVVQVVEVESSVTEHSITFHWQHNGHKVTEDSVLEELEKLIGEE